MLLFSKKRQDVYYGWYIVLALAVTETVSYGVLFYAFSVFITPMQSELGWSLPDVTGALSVALLVAGLAAVPVGYWVDRFGPRALMTTGSVAAVLLVIAWAMVESLTAYYLIWIGIGITMAAVLYEPAFAVVAKWFVHKRGDALAMITFVAGFASTIFLPLTDFLLHAIGWRGAVLVLGLILAVITIPLHGLILRRNPDVLDLRPDGLQFEKTKEKPKQRNISMRNALRSSSFWGLTMAFTLALLSATAIRVHFIAYLIEAEFDASLAAGLAGLIGAMQVFGRVIFAPLHHRFSTRFLTASLFVLQIIGLLILILTSSTVGILLFVVVFGSAYGAMTLARPALIAEFYGSEQYGRISSVMAMIVTWAITAAPLGAGLLHEKLGGYQPVLWILVAISCAAILVIPFIKSPDSA